MKGKGESRDKTGTGRGGHFPYINFSCFLIYIDFSLCQRFARVSFPTSFFAGYLLTLVLQTAPAVRFAHG